jgi:hypothetical protein
MALYYSGVPWMQSLAAPASNREFGLIENLQNLLLLGLALVCWQAAGDEATRLARRAWRALSLMVFVVFLEEIDYGNHFWALAQGRDSGGASLNLHNQGGANKVLKRSTDAGFALWLGILPFLATRLPARVRPWLASRWSIATLLIGAILSRTAHALDGAMSHNGSLTNNISEFRELTTYLVVALYVVEIRLRRKGRPVPADLAPPLQTGPPAREEPKP